MKQISGIWFPDDVGTRWEHALMHVHSIEWSVQHCSSRRTAVQAGGNIGLWPRRLAKDFQRVITFEPDALSRACLRMNVPAHVEVRTEALGDVAGTIGFRHKDLGSHRVDPQGPAVTVIALDELTLIDLDLLQLDIEGYEWHALMGAAQTIERCRPLIQVELRDIAVRYGRSNDEIRRLLASWGYVQVSEQQGSDYVFRRAA